MDLIYFTVFLPIMIFLSIVAILLNFIFDLDAVILFTLFFGPIALVALLALLAWVVPPTFNAISTGIYVLLMFSIAHRNKLNILSLVVLFFTDVPEHYAFPLWAWVQTIDYVTDVMFDNYTMLRCVVDAVEHVTLFIPRKIVGYSSRRWDSRGGNETTAIATASRLPAAVDIRGMPMTPSIRSG